MLDKLLNILDSKRFEKVLHFICFVVAPTYIVGHIVIALFQGRI
jgi:hypothetical protein